MVVFAVLAHDDPVHLARLATRLQPFPLVVHLDRKASRGDFKRCLRGLQNCRVLAASESVDVRWAGFSVVEAEIRLLRSALTLASKGEHIVLLSGADYPLVPVQDIDDYLRDHSDTQFIRYFRADDSDQAKWAVFGRHYQDANPFGRPRGTPHRKANTVARTLLGRLATAVIGPNILDGMVVCFGSQWIALTAECLDAALQKRSTKTDAYFQRVYAPDEKYLHTLVAATNFHGQTPSGGFEDAPRAGLCMPEQMANLHHVHPDLGAKWFTHEDWSEVLQSDKLFIRKVRTRDGKQLLDAIDGELLGL